MRGHLKIGDPPQKNWFVSLLTSISHPKDPSIVRQAHLGSFWPHNRETSQAPQALHLVLPQLRQLLLHGNLIDESQRKPEKKRLGTHKGKGYLLLFSEGPKGDQSKIGKPCLVLGVPSPFFAGILLLRKPSKT